MTPLVSSVSQHAKARITQRGIPPFVVGWLEEFGEQTHDHRGAVILHFNKKSRRRLEKAVGQEITRRVSERLDCYAVLSVDGNLITVGHRYQRIWH